ncbi:fungal specific transcription factor domain-containing protein, partial [Aspergillus ibericus CBS 121593]
QDWIQSHCQPSKILNDLCSSGLPWTNRRDSSVLASQPHTATVIETIEVSLPDRFITEACVALYKCGRTGLLYPLVDADALTSTIKTAYSSTDTQKPHVITARAFVFSFVAFCSSAGHSDEVTFPVDGEKYASTARQLLHAVKSGPPSLEALQTAVFLAFYHCFEGCLWAVRGALRVASHLVTVLAPDMGFFQAPSSDRNPIFRNLFWVSFLLDKELFLRIGEPPLLPAESCVPPNPGGCPFRSLARLLPCYPGIYTGTFQLSILMSKIYTELYTPEALRKSDIEILRTIRALDGELEEWRLSMPNDIRPTIHATSRPTHSQTDVDVLVLHLKFHNCLGCIHQAVSRCQTWSEEVGPVKEALRSSLNLSIQASASSLELLRTNPLTLNRECFWWVFSLVPTLLVYSSCPRLLCFYPLSALLNLFCKIVADTFDYESRAYLGIIKRVPEYLRGLDTLHVTALEREHLQLMILFSTELVALAEQQVSAGQEKDR